MPILMDVLQSVVDQQLVVGEHVVDYGTLRVCSRADGPKLTPKAAHVLLILARNAGATVTHTELMDAVWASRYPTRDVLTQAIKEIRRVLGESSRKGGVMTIPKLGYRLVLPVAFRSRGAAAASRGAPSRERGTTSLS